MDKNRPTGMLGFSIVWFGQVISLLGTSMTGFGMTIWAYEKTGTATALALVGFFFVTPMLVFSPFAGAIVDRSNRKIMMMISDLISGAATIVILLLYSTGKLEIWHLYITGAVQGVFQAFQWPAYSAAITTMLSKEHYGRANGMMALADTASGIFAPLLAGALLGTIGLVGILTIDIITFLFAIGALLFVHVPQPKITQEGIQSRGNIFKEASYGFYYIIKRPSLLGLQLVFLVGNFLVGIAYAVRAPMVLASTGNNEKVFAAVASIGAVGGVLGGVVMSAWGGPKRRVNGVLAGWAITSVSGVMLMGLGNGVAGHLTDGFLGILPVDLALGLPIWAVASFMGAFFIPIINGSNQAIWQSKVAPDLQGRVFSIRRLIAWFVNPAAMLIAGPLADKILEPAMQSENSLSQTFGWLVGTGPGAGMSLIFLVSGFLAMCVGLGSYAFRVVRDVEDILPDHDTSGADSHETTQKRLGELLEARQKLLAGEPAPEREAELRAISKELRELGSQRALKI